MSSVGRTASFNWCIFFVRGIAANACEMGDGAEGALDSMILDSEVGTRQMKDAEHGSDA